MGKLFDDIDCWAWVMCANTGSQKDVRLAAELIEIMPTIGRLYDGIMYMGPDRTRPHNAEVIAAIKATKLRWATGRRLHDDTEKDVYVNYFSPEWYAEFCGMLQADKQAFGADETFADTENYNRIIYQYAVNIGILDWPGYIAVQGAAYEGTRYGANAIDWVTQPLCKSPLHYTHAVRIIGRKVVNEYCYCCPTGQAPYLSPPTPVHAWPCYVTQDGHRYGDPMPWAGTTYIPWLFRNLNVAAIKANYPECRRIVMYCDSEQRGAVVGELAKLKGVAT